MKGFAPFKFIQINTDMANNIEIKFIDQTKKNYKSESICELFNNVPKDELFEFTIDYIYDTEFEIKNGFDWNSHLKDEDPFECDVYYQTTKIGTIQLVKFKNETFFNVIYAIPIEHKFTMTEFSPFDPYYYVSHFENKFLKSTFELGYAHPGREQRKCICEQKKDHNCTFSFSFNAIVIENDHPNFLMIRGKPELEEGEFTLDPNPTISFKDYQLRAAGFEDAFKGLLLLHFIINDIGIDYLLKMLADDDADDTVDTDDTYDNDSLDRYNNNVCNVI